MRNLWFQRDTDDRVTRHRVGIRVGIQAALAVLLLVLPMLPMSHPV